MVRIVFLVLAIVFSMNLNAAHIVGGDMTYKCLSFDVANGFFKIEVTLKVYRDSKSGGAVLDDDTAIGFFTGSGNNLKFYHEELVSLNKINPIKVTSPNPCLKVPSNIGVEEGIYKFTINLPVLTNESYMIVYQRCCRNISITNIVRPEEAGAAFIVEISPTSQQTCNDSPYFIDFPPVVICNDDDMQIDHSAFDKQGDDIRYEFCTPFTAGGSRGVGGESGADECDGVRPSPKKCPPPYEKVVFNNGASQDFPVVASPKMKINPITGIITGRPTKSGQYVVGVCAKEYRNNVLIGEIRRDFQFNVVSCKPLIYADIATDNTDDFPEKYIRINSCGEKTVKFVNKSFEQKNINSYLWQFDINGTDVQYDTRDISLTFPTIGQYKGLMVLNEGTICADSAEVEVNIFPGITADYSFDYDTCNAGPVTFVDLSVGAGGINKWSWDFSSEDTSAISDPKYTFMLPGNKQVKVKVTDKNGCEDEIVKTIKYFPVPSTFIVAPSIFIGCAPQHVFFDNQTFPLDTNYMINWDFGDGEQDFGNTISPTHLYTKEGVYDVSLKIISPIGCEVDGFFPEWVTVKAKPTADFVYSPLEPSIFNREITFTNQSTGATGYYWNFGSEGTFFDRDKVITFQDKGSYDVSLIVVNDEKCTDTAYATIDILAPVLIQFPNAFTPNDDALNDNFGPKGYFDVITNYEFIVFNRWGERIYKTNDPYGHWNGQKNNTGLLSPVGVYVYVANYTDEKGFEHNLKGHINLIR